MANYLGTVGIDPTQQMDYEVSDQYRTELFVKLKLVDSSIDAEKLNAILSSKKIDSDTSESLVQCFTHSVSNLSRKENSIDESDLKILSESLIDFLDCDGYKENLKWVAFHFQQCFQRTCRYFCKTPLKLPFEIHQKAFAVCKNVLIKNETNSDVIARVLEALPHVIDHQDFSADQQLEVFHIVQKYSNSKIQILDHCSKLEHASPYFRSLAVEELLTYARDKLVKKCHRKAILEKLPFHPDYLNIDQELRNAAITTLINLIQDTTESSSIRECAGKNLSIWLWAHEKGQTQLKEEKKYVIDEMLKIIRNSDSQSLADTIAEGLFFRICAAEESDPTAQYVFETFKELITDDKLALSTRKKLAHRMPQGTRYFMPKELYAINLFFFMLEKLSDENHPRELKTIYVEHLVWCYFYPRTCERIGERDKSLQSIQNFFNLEVLKEDPALFSTAKEAYKALNEAQAEQASHFIPFGNGLTVFVP